MNKKGQKNRVVVPVNEEQFDKLVDKLVLLYGFPSREHVIAVVANRIMHAPPDQDTFTLEYFAACIRKNIAYQLADTIAKNKAHEHGVRQLLDHLKVTPGDAQAVDELLRLAGEGSPFAKSALEELGIEFVQPPAKTSDSQKVPENETLQ